jgi:hypothetical protein
VRRPRRPAQDLRLAVDLLPVETKTAMLDGVLANRIIVGAYTDRRGGVCPMLAAHRRGGRTNFASFARAWDRYTRAKGRPRPATDRELRTLVFMLEASLFCDQREHEEVADAIAGLKAAKARRAAERADRRPDTGERDRTSELSRRHGWAWMRLFRRYDDYEAALEQELDRLASENGDSSERELERV